MVTAEKERQIDLTYAWVLVDRFQRSEHEYHTDGIAMRDMLRRMMVGSHAFRVPGTNGLYSTLARPYSTCYTSGMDDTEPEDVNPERRMVPFRLPVDLVDRIDAARGHETRTAFTVRALEAALGGPSRTPVRGEAGGKRASGFTPRPKSDTKKKGR